MPVVMAVTLLLGRGATGLREPRQREPRYALRFALGVVALATAAFISRRRRRPATAAGQGEGPRPGIVARLTASPTPRTAFLLGVLLFAPSTTFIAAVQVVATANAGVPLTAGAIPVVVILTALGVWLPLLAYLAAPDATTRSLAAANGWLRESGGRLVIAALWIAGTVLVVNGARGVWR